jgi:hypothetical protein
VKTIWCMINGATALLILKYGVVGLDAWNRVLHPGLVIAPNQRAFRHPFLGLLERRCDAQDDS